MSSHSLRELKATSKSKGKIPFDKQFLESSPLVPGATVPASCGSTITPSCLRTLYNTAGYTVTSATNTIGVTGYLQEYANNNDLKTFFKVCCHSKYSSLLKITTAERTVYQKKYRTDITASPTFTTTTLNGGLNDQSDPGVEANLGMFTKSNSRHSTYQLILTN